MIPLALKFLLSGWARLTGGFSALLSLARTYPLQAALIASLCLSGWLWHGNTKRDHTIASLHAQIAAFTEAQKQAQAKQNASDRVIFDSQLAQNKALEKTHALLETARADAVRQYVSTHRLPAPDCSASSGAGVASVHPDPRPAAEGSTDPAMVAIKPDDLDALSKAAMQNTERGEFLRGLVEAGFAVPESQVPR